MAQYGMRDPDDVLVAVFKNVAVENVEKTRLAGRPIFDDEERIEIRCPGSKDVKVFPATAFSRWVEDPNTTGLRIQTYAERFSHQYRQFKAHATQTKSGTPLERVPFLTEARRAELRAQNIYTVEALAAVDGNELKNLGPGGREFKNNAIAYIEHARTGAADPQLMAELEAIKSRNALLEEDMTRLKEAAKLESPYDGTSNEQLRELITTKTGHPPLGSMSRKSLIRLAQECDREEA